MRTGAADPDITSGDVGVYRMDWLGLHSGMGVPIDDLIEELKTMKAYFKNGNFDDVRVRIVNEGLMWLQCEGVQK